MKAKDLRSMTDEELKNKLNELKEQLYKLRFQNALGQAQNPMKIREVKKDIARIYTILRERELKIEV